MRSWLWVCVVVLSGSRPRLAMAHGLPDRGVFPDLDSRVELGANEVAASDGVLDEKRGLLVLYAGARPLAVYAVGGDHKVSLGDLDVALRASDAAAAARALAGRPVRRLAGPVRGGDRDADGIPDALDVLVGAKKVALNGARYVDGYVDITYPGGDVARDTGVCTDVIVRALRNAGIDLQVEVAQDIARAPAAYPMVKRGNRNIDHRRVKTMIRWFRRHAAAHGTDPRAPGDPFLPGDVVFFDTFPSRDGPDHVGIVSDRAGPSGLPLVVNNWTEGFVESEMDLLLLVPVTDRFRVGE